MFLSESQGKDFRNIFLNNNKICGCMFNCMCKSKNTIKEGFENEDGDEDYISETDIYSATSEYNRSRQQLMEETNNYINKFSSQENNNNIKQFLSKNVQVSSVENANFNFIKCISNKDMDNNFQIQETPANPTEQDCANIASSLNSNAFILKNNKCYIAKENVNIIDIPYYSETKYDIVAVRRLRNNYTTAAAVFKNGDVGVGYYNKNNSNTLTPPGGYQSTINKKLPGCHFKDGAKINIQYATYSNKYR